MLKRRIVLASVVLCIGWCAGAIQAGDDLWQTDFEAAKTKAKAENKLLLVDFTGSDWCGWCKMLVAEVFSKKEFKDEAPKKFLLVELDYPHDKELSDKLKKQNEELRVKYKVHGYPTILLMDAEGQVMAHTGYQAGGPEKYIKHLDKLIEVYGTVATMKKELEASKGLDRAKLLNKLINAYDKLRNESDEIQVWSKEIVSLDADNKAGLRDKYTVRIAMADIAKLKEEEKFDEIKPVAEKALALPAISTAQRESICQTLCACCVANQDYAGGAENLESILKATPDHPNKKRLEMVIGVYKGMAKKIAKLKVELKKAEGLDRAKILDKMVDVVPIPNSIKQGNTSPEVEKWSLEIIALDPDNKAGLKVKQEFRLQLVKAFMLRRKTETSTEAKATLEKAIAMPELASDQVQLGHYYMAILFTKDQQKRLEQLEKALEAAPDSKMAPQIKRVIKQLKTPEKDAEKSEKKSDKKSTKKSDKK